MGFIRVRAATGPLHEFDTPEASLAARPHVFVVVDPEPVPEPRPVTYVTAPEARKPRVSRARKKRTPSASDPAPDSPK